jgi:peptidyl-prolyl cis-trans isomerase B (cyclophilin B)
VSPTRDRQRAAARARLEREMAERAAAAARRRKRTAIIGAVVAVVVVLCLVILLVTLSGGKKKPAAAPTPSASTSANAAPASCHWKPNPAPSPSTAPIPELKNVGTPPASGEPRSGTRDMTINTNLGPMVIRMDLAKAPCTAASFTYLANDKHFFDNTSCHRLVSKSGTDQQSGQAQDFHVLQCGDPTGTGKGGPTYQFDNEYVPSDQRPSYPAGSVAMANSGPNTNGSQFFIVFGDTLLPADYTLFGTVVQGLDVAKQVGAAGDDGAFAQDAGGGHPKKKITFTTVTVGPPSAGASAAPSPSH